MSVKIYDGDSSLFVNIPDARLSEGCVYSASHERYYWIDVFQGIIFSFKKDKSDLKKIEIVSKSDIYPERVGCVIPSKENSNVVYFGGKYGLAKANFINNEWEYICLYSSSSLKRDWDRMRSNDGNSDPNDNTVLYIGIMNDFHVGECTTEGAVMKFTIDKTITCECVYDGIRIPNSINFMGNAKIFLTDSLNFQILQIPYNSNDWVKDAVQAIDIKANNQGFTSPEPDGSFILDDRYFLTAVWSTSKVQVYDLQNRQLLNEYLIPGIERVSCCCLGASNNKIVVTTASKTIETKGSTAEDLNGALYEIELHDLPCSSSINEKDGKIHV